MWIFGILLIVLAIVLAGVYLSDKRKLAQMEATETSSAEFLKSLATSMADGVGAGSLRYLSEIKGKTVCPAPLLSELAGVYCVYYSMNVDREYEETYYEEDSNGNRQQKTRTGFDNVASNKRTMPFYVEDATGQIKVNPDGAEIISEKVYSRFEPDMQKNADFLKTGDMNIDLPASFHNGDRRTTGYRYNEEALEVGRDVYVLGEVTDRELELCVVAPLDKGKKFIISSKGEEALMREGKNSMNLSLIGAILCGVIGMAILIFSK